MGPHGFYYSCFSSCLSSRRSKATQPRKQTPTTGHRLLQESFLSLPKHSMEDYNRSRSYANGMMQLEPYYGPSRPSASYDLRSYSAAYAQSQMANRDFKLKKGKSTSGSSSSKSWSFSDPEFQRKKRVASYKMYSVEGKVKGSLRKSFRWLKDKYTQVVYGWW